MIPRSIRHRIGSLCAAMGNPMASVVTAALFFALHAAPLLADEPRLTDIIVTNTQENLLLYLTVEGAFTEPMEAAVLSGVPLEFRFFIKLSRARSYWQDKSMANLTVTHGIRYNTDQKTFHVTRSWEPDKEHVAATFAEASRLMCEINSLRIAALFVLEKGSRYQIRAKAELNKQTLPLSLHHVLFFMSLWDLTTDWYAIDFTY